MNYKKNHNKGESLYSLLAMGGKPDYLGLDKDGNKEELMREAANQMTSGGRVYKFGGKYENDGEIPKDTGLTFILKENEQGGQEPLFLIHGKPVDTKAAIDYYDSNMGPREEFNEWFSKTSKGKYGKGQDIDTILAQMSNPGYKEGQTYSGGQARASQSRMLSSSQGGTEGALNNSREDVAKQILSGLEDWRRR